MNPALKNSVAVVGILSLLLALFISFNSLLLMQMLAAESFDPVSTLGGCIVLGTLPMGFLLSRVNLRMFSAVTWTLWAITLCYGLAVTLKMAFLFVLSPDTNITLMSASLWVNGIILTAVGHSFEKLERHPEGTEPSEK